MPRVIFESNSVRCCITCPRVGFRVLLTGDVVIGRPRIIQRKLFFGAPKNHICVTVCCKFYAYFISTTTPYFKATLVYCHGIFEPRFVVIFIPCCLTRMLGRIFRDVHCFVGGVL